MRNVEEVYSALRKISTRFSAICRTEFCFSPRTSARCWFRRRRGGFWIDRDSILGRHAREIFDARRCWADAARGRRSGREHGEEEIRTETGGASRPRWTLSTTMKRTRAWARWSRCTIWSRRRDRVGAGAFAAHGGHRPAHFGRRPRGQEPDQRHRGASGAFEVEAGRSEGPATRHLEVIDAEIRRLDRVVQTLVDFSRPVELQLREQDLRPVIGDVLALAADELTTRKITLISRMPEEPLIANVDADLLKQAALNVIQNGAQAMPEGGGWRWSRRGPESVRKPDQASAGFGKARAPMLGEICRAAHCRRGRGHSRRDPRKDLRSLFHDQERGQRHRTGHDLPHPAVTSWERGSTIETRPWHGIPAANSTRRRGPGTPALQPASVLKIERGWGMKSPARCVAWLLPFLLTGCFQCPFTRTTASAARCLRRRIVALAGH
jgi:hypothetical protein